MRYLLLALALTISIPADAGIFGRLFGGRSRGCSSCSKSTAVTVTSEDGTQKTIQLSSYYKGPLEWGRWCSRSGCGMCNGIEAHNRALGLPWPRRSTTVAVGKASTSSSSGSSQGRVVVGYKTEEYKVKRCNGRRCWYETRTRKVPIYGDAPPQAWAEPIEQATPIPVVEAVLGIVNPNPGQRLYDLGCGDGRVLERALEDYGCEVYGCEIDSGQLDKAKQRLSTVGGWWKVEDRDATELDLAKADIVYVYQFPDLLDKIRWDTLKPGAKVVSLNHDVKGLNMDKESCNVDGKDFEIFVYEKPNHSLEYTTAELAVPALW